LSLSSPEGSSRDIIGALFSKDWDWNGRKARLEERRRREEERSKEKKRRGEERRNKQQIGKNK
jgi:hypothetical protein